MKLRVLLFAVASVGFVGCEEGGGEQPAAEQQPAAPAEPAQPAPAPEPEKPVEVPPAEVCGQLAAAAKANEEAKVGSVISGGVEALSGEGVKEAFMAHWASATCAEGKVDGDKATVPVTFAAAKAAADIAFVKADGAWKLDTAAYLAKYPVEAKAKKGKKGKKAKKAKKAN